MKCRGHEVPEMVTPAMRTTAVAGCKYLERRDPMKISIFCLTHYCMTFFAISAEIKKDARFPLRLSMALSFVVGAIGRTGLRKEVGLLRPGPRGLKVIPQRMVR